MSSYVNRPSVPLTKVAERMGGKEEDLNEDSSNSNLKSLFDNAVTSCSPGDPTTTYIVELGWGVCYCPERPGVNPNPNPEQGKVLATIRRTAIGSGKVRICSGCLACATGDDTTKRLRVWVIMSSLRSYH